MAYNVAEAEVTVLPDAEGFGRRLREQIGPEADRIGRDAGDSIGRGIQERVRLAIAGLPDAEIGLDTSRASAALDRFVAETRARADVAGRTAGRSMGQNLADGTGEGFQARSALIGTAIALGLMAGAPVAIASAGVLFGGIAAVAVHNQQEIETAAAGASQAWSDMLKQTAQQAVPSLVLSLDQLGGAADDLRPEFEQAFGAIQPAVDGVTQGVIALVTNAMPGLNHAVSALSPVMGGLSDVLAQIGTGLGDFFTIISAHAPAAGQVFSSLGDILAALLPTLGTLIGEGAELGAIVLPPLAAILGVVNDALQVLGPLLPGIVLGFVGWKAAALLAPMLGTLATSLDTVGIKALFAADELTLSRAAGTAAAAGFGAAATGARGLQAAMGPIGWVMAGIGLAIPALISAFSDQDGMQKQVKASADAMTQALQQSKGAITDDVRAVAAKQAQDAGLLAMAPKWGVASSTIVDALLGNKDALAEVTAGEQAYESGLSASSTAAYQHVQAMNGNTAAYNQAALSAGELSNKNDKAIESSKAHAQALTDLSNNTVDQVAKQQQLAAAIEGSTSAEERNTTRLQGLSNAASAAQTQINLLKGALDALTGKAVTMDQAEIAVTQSVDAATQAVKNKTAALAFNNGQLDLSNAKSAQASQLLISLSGSQKQVIATAEQQGQTMDQVNKIADDQRAQFIKVAEQLGATAEQAGGLADRYLGIPKDVHTEVSADTADATAKAAAFKRMWESINSRKVTITYDQNGVITGKWIGNRTTGIGMEAMGGIVHAYAAGGIEPNMAAGIAQIVPPQTYRLIGDRITDDEAYIPINDSARSLSILAQTANRMGYGLTPPDAPTSRADSRSYVFNISSPANPQAIARSVRDVQRDVEFLHG